MPTSTAPRSILLTMAMGAAPGAIGVWALDRLDWFLYDRMSDADHDRTRAARPNGEPPAEALVTALSAAGGMELSPRTHAAASMATHYTIGIAPAVGYALLRDRLPGHGVARGAAYGALLFALQDEGLNTVTGLGGRPGDYPWQDHARGLAAHLLYGVATEAALNVMEALVERQAAQAAELERA
jgi:uncharacterized membrane protein YagU involved in acid resistance